MLCTLNLGRRALALAAIAGLTALQLGACTPKSAQGINTSLLDNQIAAAIGDPSTCLLLADAKTGQVVYRYGSDFNCARTLPACDFAGVMNAKAGLPYAKRPGGRMASCASVPDGSRQVGWAAGRVQSAKRDLVFSAVMEGERALPGHEINARLFDAFQKAGL
ncbi:MAG TPA: hypothetical protein VHS81_08570 [Caulobacteraceae bacterium]|nr:hypothetical protein [Caulobacteraceae bacterium]